MRIAYNGLQFCGPMNGTRRYSQTSFEQIVKHDARNDYILYTYAGAPVYASPVGFEERKHKSVSQMLLAESALSQTPCFDVLHMPHPFHSQIGVPLCVSMLLAPVSILTVLDLILYRTPDYVSDSYHKNYCNQLRISTAWADRIIVLSEYTKSDFVREFDLDEAKFDVVYPGVDKRFKPIKAREWLATIRQKYARGGEYILCLASYYSHKNIKKLVFAFHRLVETTDIQHHLVLAGRSDTLSADYNAIKGYISRNKLDDRIFFHEAIPEEEIVACYNAADLFVYPSLHEGFGLPLLEAMACGVPVVASNATAIPEAVGDAGQLVDATNIESLCEGIHAVLSDQKLRERHVRNGLERARRFSWEESARRHVEIYEREHTRHLPDRKPKLTDAWKLYLANALRNTPSCHLTLAQPLPDENSEFMQWASPGLSDRAAAIYDPTLVEIIHRIRSSQPLDRMLKALLVSARSSYRALRRITWHHE